MFRLVIRSTLLCIFICGFVANTHTDLHFLQHVVDVAVHYVFTNSGYNKSRVVAVNVTNPAWGERGRVAVKCSMRNACNRSRHIAVLTIAPASHAYFVRRALGNDSAFPMHASPSDTGGRNEASYSYSVM